MKLLNFETESWMTLHENNCLYNLADSCAKALTFQELYDLIEDKETFHHHLMDMTLDYGPIEGSHHLKEGILQLYQRKNIEELAICHGGINGNELVLMTLLDKGDHMISFTPTYQQLYSFPESFGVEVDLIQLQEDKQWIPDIEEFKALIKENTKMICLNLPNNPTGTTLDNDMLWQLVKLCKENNLYLMVDEAYRGLYNELSISDIYEKGISTSGLSKILSTAGLRIGWIKTQDQELIKRINERRDYSIISAGPLNDYLACLVLEHYDEILKRNRDILETNKKYLEKWLVDNPYISCTIPQYGTICFLKYHFDMPSKELCERLQNETGVFFVPGACFDCEYHLRFGLANDPDVVKKGLTVFKKWLEKNDTL